MAVIYFSRKPFAAPDCQWGVDRREIFITSIGVVRNAPIIHKSAVLCTLCSLEVADFFPSVDHDHRTAIP